MKRNALKGSVAGAVLALGCAFSLSSSALPSPPESGWIVLTWVDNGIVRGQTHYGNCPPDTPYPLDWGYPVGIAMPSYQPCGIITSE